METVHYVSLSYKNEGGGYERFRSEATMDEDG